jgi:hypothetical protein
MPIVLSSQEDWGHLPLLGFSQLNVKAATVT